MAIINAIQIINPITTNARLLSFFKEITTKFDLRTHDICGRSLKNYPFQVGASPHF